MGSHGVWRWLVRAVVDEGKLQCEGGVPWGVEVSSARDSLIGSVANVKPESQHVTESLRGST